MTPDTTFDTKWQSQLSGTCNSFGGGDNSDEVVHSMIGYEWTLRLSPSQQSRPQVNKRVAWSSEAILPTHFSNKSLIQDIEGLPNAPLWDLER